MTQAQAQARAQTIDAFHRGRFHLVQPAMGCHRAGLDAMLLAAAVPSAFSGRMADLGAGVGAAGLAVLSRCATATALLVERDPAMAEFAGRTLAHNGNQALAARAELLLADVSLRGDARHAVGLENRSCDFVIMNPPFNEAVDRASPDPMRAAAHVMEPDLFESWIRTAAAILRPRGGLAIIARPNSLADILKALEGRFGRAELKPIHPRRDKPAIRLVVRAWRGRRGPLNIVPPLTLHDKQGHDFTAAADAAINGRTSLFGD